MGTLSYSKNGEPVWKIERLTSSVLSLLPLGMDAQSAAGVVSWEENRVLS